MTEIERSINIEAPVNQVFEYASDYLNWPKFFEGVSDFMPITEITRGNGTKFIYKAKMLGMNVTVGTELQQFKENEGWVGKSFKGIKHKTQWIFKKLNGNTEFTYILNYKFPLGSFLDKKFMQPAWIKIIEKSLQNLKRIMELK
jgi:uncharacterized membrane protein